MTPRRWLAQANPPLASLLDRRIGKGWRRDLTQLAALRPMADQPAFARAFRHAKRENKLRLANWVEQNMGIVIDTDAMFDVQVKRIHEYKRQLLNVLHVVTRYQRIIAAHEAGEPCRHGAARGGVRRQGRFGLPGGQAGDPPDQRRRAPTINNDARVGKLLKVVFLPNYSVSLAEIIMPAADLSEQISTAGTEASGTGNMKFALNGALTIGTLDGANVEMKENVGDDNIFIFGNTTPQVADIRAGGYQPHDIYQANAELQARCWTPSATARSRLPSRARYQGIFDALVNWGDHYLLLADYASYVETQDKVDALYQRRGRLDAQDDPERGGHGRVLVRPDHRGVRARDLAHHAGVAPALSARRSAAGRAVSAAPLGLAPRLRHEADAARGPPCWRCPSARPRGHRARSRRRAAALRCRGSPLPPAAAARPARRRSPAVVEEHLTRGIDRPGSRSGRVADRAGVGARQVELIELAISGAVMMKITSRTSITSTSGVTLMSDKGRWPPAPVARLPLAGPLPRELRPNAIRNLLRPAC